MILSLKKQGEAAYKALPKCCLYKKPATAGETPAHQEEMYAAVETATENLQPYQQ
jgi:hypothetical protein